jgi:hypothetical protein
MRHNQAMRDIDYVKSRRRVEIVDRPVFRSSEAAACCGFGTSRRALRRGRFSFRRIDLDSNRLCTTVSACPVHAWDRGGNVVLPVALRPGDASGARETFASCEFGL